MHEDIFEKAFLSMKNVLSMTINKSPYGKWIWESLGGRRCRKKPEKKKLNGRRWRQPNLSVDGGRGFLRKYRYQYKKKKKGKKRGVE